MLRECTSNNVMAALPAYELPWYWWEIYTRYHRLCKSVVTFYQSCRRFHHNCDFLPATWRWVAVWVTCLNFHWAVSQGTSGVSLSLLSAIQTESNVWNTQNISAMCTHMKMQYVVLLLLDLSQTQTIWTIFNQTKIYGCLTFLKHVVRILASPSQPLKTDSQRSKGQ